MWALGVEPEQVIEELVITEGEVVIEEQIFVVVHELFLESTVKAFGMGVHLGVFGIGVPMSEAPLSNGGGEVLHEFTAVVGEQRLDAIREHGGHEIEKALGGGAGMTGGGEREGEAGTGIRGGEQIAAHPVTDALDGIQGHTLAG